MKISQSDWQGFRELPAIALKHKIFAVMRETALEVQQGELDDPSILETVPRLADLVDERPELQSFREPLSALARATGLWNYIDKEVASPEDLLVAEAVTVQELGGITLHRAQLDALNKLLEGRNLILSAPTSFGKSLLIDALLLSGKYQRIAIVLPTIALLDEFRRRLQRRVGERYQIVLHPRQEAASERVVFLGTQERLIHRSDLGHLDLTVVDEFYKLDPTREDERSITLNAAVYKLLSRSEQFFFLGPNIDNVRIAQDARWSFEFLRTRFATVAVDTQDLSTSQDKPARLLEAIKDDANWPCLVFVSSPDKANQLSLELASQVSVASTGKAFADWLSENVGDKSPLVNAALAGFGVHHGRVQRAVASQMVRLFNDQTLPVLFCTSTLIEGVNTAAKTVVIYDKTINKADYDFFTYSNIKGRAGRLGQHHIGKVLLFNSPPDAGETLVTPTLFGDEDDAPDEFVVHLEPGNESQKVDARVEGLKSQLGLSIDELRLATSVGLETAIQLRDAVTRALQRKNRLVWKGYPGFAEVRELVQLVTGIKGFSPFGLHTVMQLTKCITDLRSKATLAEFLAAYSNWYPGDKKAYDNIFKFLRACEYGLPQYFSVVEAFVKKSYPEADYGLLVQGLSSWFRPSVLKDLDEEGLPIQILERFHHSGDDYDAVRTRLRLAMAKKGGRLSAFERTWIAAALDS